MLSALNEIRLLASFAHPRIVRLYETFMGKRLWSIFPPFRVIQLALEGLSDPAGVRMNQFLDTDFLPSLSGYVSVFAPARICVYVPIYTQMATTYVLSWSTAVGETWPWRLSVISRGENISMRESFGSIWSRSWKVWKPFTNAMFSIVVSFTCYKPILSFPAPIGNELV